MISRSKVQASALQSVLTVSLIIVLVLSAIMTVALHTGRIYQEKSRMERLERNAVSAMSLLLAGAIDFENNTTLDLYGNQTDSVMLRKESWGVYDIFQVLAFSTNDTVQKVALSGVAMLPEETYALYLADQHLPLSVSGETIIKGSVFIPEAGIRKSYIEGREFTSKEVVAGSTDFSDTDLPKLNTGRLEKLSQNFELDSIATFFPVEAMSDSISNPFEKPTLIIYTEDSLYLQDILKGNIKIQSESDVRISAHSQLENIQIYANSIRVDEGFEGTFQAFARDSIRIEKDVKLNYPSVLGLVPDIRQREQEFNPKLELGEGSEIAGIVFSVWPEKEGLYPLISMDSSYVYGQVFSAGMLQLKGEVIGTTITQGFILRTSSTLYENFVLDGVMNRKALSKYYLGSSLINTNPVKGILKWL